MTLAPTPSTTPGRQRALYSAPLSEFMRHSETHVLGELAARAEFAVERTQRDAWLAQIDLLRSTLAPYQREGWIAFEYTVPRVGKRIDVLIVLRHVLFVLEFKIGDKAFSADATAQVWDYALDLKNFHSTSHDKTIVPILIATGARTSIATVSLAADQDGIVRPIHTAPGQLGAVIEAVLGFCDGNAIDLVDWASGRYSPTPTIIEAAMALYGGHGVESISRSDAGAINLSRTSESLAQIIRESRERKRKSICFVTGVPGAGKTLVGLNIATQHIDSKSALHSVFLSGNGPLVAILREALARDKVRREKAKGRKASKSSVRSEVKAFIQNVHHFRDECLVDLDRPPIEHVALFDEAQRAWNKEQTAAFMQRKKNKPGFTMSEPEFLISCMNRHPDWAVVVCLVGGGQEINTGEAGIGEWIRAVLASYPDWHVHVSPQLYDSEFGAGEMLKLLENRERVHYAEELHLAVSMRSFRAENVAALVKSVLDLDQKNARATLNELRDRYAIVLTRDVEKAKAWLKQKARGSERYGMVVSSQAERLRPHAIHVRAPMDPIHWFLDEKDDVRSSYYLEDVATEFHVQGLELDWTCIVWDADFRHSHDGWRHWSFRGAKWQRINKPEKQTYLKNAYRVLLTRARQGMVVVVPRGDAADPTRSPAFYDSTFDYLKEIGFDELR